MKPTIAIMGLVALLARGAAQPVQRLDTLYVGKAPASTAYMHGDSSEATVVVRDTSAPTGQRVLGHMSMRQRVVNGGLFRVEHFSSPMAEVTDSIMTGGTGVKPLWETSHQTSGFMRLEFDGRHTTGEIIPIGKAKQAIDQTAAVPPFNSSDIEILIQVLPLAPTYSALVASYEYEAGGLRIDTLTVIGRARTAWIVRVSRGQSSSMTYWFDPDTKRMIKTEYASASGGWTTRVVRE